MSEGVAFDRKRGLWVAKQHMQLIKMVDKENEFAIRYCHGNSYRDRERESQSFLQSSVYFILINYCNNNNP